MVRGRISVRYRFGSPFSSKRLWFVDSVLWLCPSLSSETLKWLSSLPILMHKSFWWWQCSDSYIVSLSPHLHTPFPPFSPSLISRTVSVDVKHHVYLVRWLSIRSVEEDKRKEKWMNSRHSSGAVWESRWPSWAVRPNELSGFRGRKELLNRASSLVTACP